MNEFNEPGSIAPTGLHFGGTKYMVLQGEAGAVIRGKKVRIFKLSYLTVKFYMIFFHIFMFFLLQHKLKKN